MGQVPFFYLALFIVSSATNADATKRTTLATFNTALVPFYGAPNPNGPQLEERLSLLIEEVKRLLLLFVVVVVLLLLMMMLCVFNSFLTAT